MGYKRRFNAEHYYANEKMSSGNLVFDKASLVDYSHKVTIVASGSFWLLWLTQTWSPFSTPTRLSTKLVDSVLQLCCPSIRMTAKIFFLPFVIMLVFRFYTLVIRFRSLFCMATLLMRAVRAAFPPILTPPRFTTTSITTAQWFVRDFMNNNSA